MTNRVLRTTAPVILNAKHVRVDPYRIDILAKFWDSFKDLWVPLWSEDSHLIGASGDAQLNYLFVLDALNFCFWPDREEDRWQIKYQAQDNKWYYQDKWYRGYFALSAALRRAYENNVPITDFRYLKQITPKEFKSIFSDKGKLPLLKKRREILQDSAKRMLRRYDGQVKNLVISANGSALKLAYKLAKEFPSFNDQAVYNGKPVWFLKRAQILVADIWGEFCGKGVGRFDDIDKLTAFADYRLPELLEYYGILEYAVDLKKKILDKKLIPAGSKEEIEIRAATIWAVEYLKQAIGGKFNSLQIDWILWNESQKLKSRLPPHHRTRTIYY